MNDINKELMALPINPASAAITAARLAASKMIVDSGYAFTEADAVIFKLRGFEQSLTDPQLWNKWS